MLVKVENWFRKEKPVYPPVRDLLNYLSIFFWLITIPVIKTGEGEIRKLKEIARKRNSYKY